MKHSDIENLTVENLDPAGYYILAEMVEVEETTESGIVLSSNHVNREQSGISVAKILKFGPLCYQNHSSGCNSPKDWGIEEGDYVQFPTHTYMRAVGEDSKLIYLLDHEIKAKVTP